MLHPLAGVLSAYGMGLADVRALREQTVELPLRETAEDGEGRTSNDVAHGAAEEQLAALRASAAAELEAQGFAEDEFSVEQRAAIKYAGTDVALEIPWSHPGAMGDAFRQLHRRRYGFLMPQHELIVDSLVVEAIGHHDRDGDGVDGRGRGRRHRDRCGTSCRRPYGCTRAARGTQRRSPAATSCRTAPSWLGPAIVCEPTSTTVIEPGWQAEMLAGGELLLRRCDPLPRPSADLSRRSPLLLEVFNNLFMSVAEQMGATLANTASSVNIKERLDFSCAIFDRQGDLVANAPHLPVHLGSMGSSVKAVMERHGHEFRRGDAYLLNSPYAGGTHLPDLTVVTPVFVDAYPLFFVASRAHHADIGGITPGSMPPGSRTIAEEGVLIEDFRLTSRGELREAEVAALLGAGPHPVRDLAQNLADLRAQVAANARGVTELQRVVDEFGSPVVQAYMRHVQDNAEEAVRRAIDRIGDGSFLQEMDDGSVVAVRVAVDRDARRATVDFTGTSPQRADNFNAPRPCVRLPSSTSSAPSWTPTSPSTPAA